MDQLQLTWPSTARGWDKTETEWLKTNYPILGQEACANFLGRSLSSIRAKASRMGLKQDQSSDFFKRWQLHARLSKIGKKRPDQALVMKALRDEGKMLMTASGKASLSIARKQWLSENEHPRGMLGKKHSEQFKKDTSKRAQAMWENPGYKGNQYEHRQKLSDRMMLMQKDGILRQGYSRGKQGKRADLNDKYFRSAWEANYARYLNFLIKNKSIFKWEFEPDTFWFHEIKRGCRTYLPDFKIWEKENSEPYYIEVKGWMDAKSKTKLKRMQKYYPEVKILLVQKKEYYSIKKSVKMLIPDWEE